MYPLFHSKSSLTFTDLRGRIDDDQSAELNLGLAHRYVTEDPLGLTDEAVLGYYGFADRLESRFDNTFYQATGGFEYFTRDYSLRVNGYRPEDSREPTTAFTQLQATGTQIFFEDRQNYERPLPGYDVELGRTFRFDGWQLYGRGSYFRFHHSDVAEIEGERFRAGVQFDGSHPEVYLPEGSQLTLGVEWQNDDIREEQTFGIARLRVPFGTVESRGSRVQSETPPENSDSRPTIPDSRRQTHDSRLRSWQKDRLTERIERDVDVVTGDNSNRIDTQPAVLRTTGETLTNVGVAESSAEGKGTVRNPGNLASAVNTAGTDGTVFVLGQLETDGVLVPGGQTLTRGNLPVIQSADGQHIAALETGDRDAVIEGTASNPILRLDTGTSGQTIQDLTFTGGRNAIRANQVDTLTIDNVTVKNTGDSAIRFNNTGNVTIENSMVNGSLDLGGSFGGRIQGTTVKGQLQAGFNFSGTLLSDTVGSLKIGSDADGRVADVTVRSGNLAVGEGAGQGAEDRFEMERVTVASGDMTMGQLPGATDGSLRMDTVTVKEGFLEFDGFVGNGGKAIVNHITTGDTLAVGDYAGANAGSFEVLSSTIESDNLTFGSNAADLGGSVRLEKNQVLGGSIQYGSLANAAGITCTGNTDADGNSIDSGCP